MLQVIEAFYVLLRLLSSTLYESSIVDYTIVNVSIDSTIQFRYTTVHLQDWWNMLTNPRLNLKSWSHFRNKYNRAFMGLSESNLFVSEIFDTCWLGPPPIVSSPVKDFFLQVSVHFLHGLFHHRLFLIPILLQPISWEHPSIPIQHLNPAS